LLAGFLEGRELADLIQGASFVIVPSEWYENNPLSILEAYAWGKPAIGAEIGGIPEIIKDGRTGFLFQSRKVDSLIEKLTLAETISTNHYKVMYREARSFAESFFEPNSHYERLLDIYQQTINET